MANDERDNNADQEPEVLDAASDREPLESKIVLARHVMPSHLPIIPLVDRPFFPKMMVPMVIERDEIKKMVLEAYESDSKHVGLVLAHPPEDTADDVIRIESEDLHSVGVIAEITQLGQAGDDGPIQVLLGVLERFRITHIVAEEPIIVAGVSYIVETDMEINEEQKAYALALIRSIKELIKLNPLHKEELTLFMTRSHLNEPGRLADFAGALTTADANELQQVLETVSVRERIEKVLVLLKKEMDISRLQGKITKQIEEKISSRQREFFLREQLKAIKNELGITKEGPAAEHDRFAERLEKLTLPDEARERVDEEMEKLKLLEPSSAEFNVTRSYLDWLTSLPWGAMTDDRFDIAAARKVLDRDHYGLDDVKDRILEFLSVGIMKGDIAGSIICFVGPPGVGKTSVGKSIAESIGRNFYRFSVGGARDEAEIKGHRRTYIGALPGKFIQAMKVCKSANPVIMIDEIDKMGASFQGDPASALLEVLDPEQNREFLDHYLDVRFDLSNVLFICTANVLDTIPRPLLDRMEVIKLAGYIKEEKLQIARRFLIPKQLKAHGVKRTQVKITAAALRDIIDGYAREPGVRGLEKHIKKIIRKSVKSIVEGKVKEVKVEVKDVFGLLGKRLFTEDQLFKEAKPGVVMGLAWTSMGGDTLYIEATKVKQQRPGFKQTGQLGDVMVESSELAYTYIRSFLDDDEEAMEIFKNSFIHLHVPAGATPKDGPSAGITMATALYSLVKQTPVKRALAMTGELSLTGVVMPIGGVKEKTIAAKRAHVKEIIFPSENRTDFEELPDHIKKGLKPHFVDRFEQVVKMAFRK